MFEFGSIVLVPFPFTDLTSTKVRPALVVSKATKTTNDVILCFITSQVDDAIPSTLRLHPTTKTGLKVDSLVRFDKIATLEKGIVLGELGRVDPSLLRKHRKIFFDVFGF